MGKNEETFLGVGNPIPTPCRDSPGHARPVNGNWLDVLRRYLAFTAAANLLWESAHLPLYTIWREAEAGKILFAVAHCTAGDILIATAALVTALVVVRNAAWPDDGYRQVAMLTIAIGLGYTIFSEWLNTEVRESWAYTEIMPTLPVLGTGLSPLAQWIAVPLVAFWWACRSPHIHLQPKKECPS